MQSKITLIGLYNFDNSLFSNLTFPDGIDRDLAIDRILNKSEEFEVLYSNFDYLKDRIGTWSKIWERTFEKWVNALAVEYDPLYNFDRHEFYTDARARDYRDKRAEINNGQLSTGSEETSKSVSNTITGSETGSNTEQFVNAYDGGYTGKEKEESSAVTNQTVSGDAESTIKGVNNTVNSNSLDSDASGVSNEMLQHEARLFGNIGVTTSQQMLKDELDIATWNLYEHISDIFIKEFCILVY